MAVITPKEQRRIWDAWMAGMFGHIKTRRKRWRKVTERQQQLSKTAAAKRRTK